MHRFCLFACVLLCAAPAYGFKGAPHTASDRMLLHDQVNMHKGAWEEVHQGNLGQDSVFSLSFGDDTEHFNDCRFSDASMHQATQYSHIVRALEEDRHRDAQAMFGEVLHAVQDFYAHSNWIESLSALPEDQIPLLTEIVGMSPYQEHLWPQIKPYHPYPIAGLPDVVFLEGEPPPGWTITPHGADAHRFQVSFKGKSYIGVVTGVVAHRKACPARASIGHWDRRDPYHGLNKDKLHTDVPALLHEKSLHYATQQTLREICRLRSLADEHGVLAQFNTWFVDQGTALGESCPTLSSTIPYDTALHASQPLSHQGPFLFQQSMVFEAMVLGNFTYAPEQEGEHTLWTPEFHLGLALGGQDVAARLHGGVNHDEDFVVSLSLRNGLYEGAGVTGSVFFNDDRCTGEQCVRVSLDYQWGPWANALLTTPVNLVLSAGVYDTGEEYQYDNRLGVVIVY